MQERDGGTRCVSESQIVNRILIQCAEDPVKSEYVTREECGKF